MRAPALPRRYAGRALCRTALPVVAIAALWLCSTGCTARSVAPEPLPHLPDPAAYVRSASETPAGASLAGIARVTIRAGNTSQTYRTVFAARYPDGLRLEVLGLFNQPALLISADTDTGITLCVTSENAWYRGPACPETMQRISGIRMDPHDIIRMLHGHPPGPDPYKSHVTCTQDNGNYMCTLEHADTIQHLWINPRTLTVTRSRLFEHGLPMHDIRYDTIRSHGDRRIPETIHVFFDSTAVGFDIRIHNPMTEPIEPGRLALHAPQHIPYQSLQEFFERNN